MTEARIYNGERTVPSINGAGKMGQPHTRKQLDPSLTPHTKSSSKWITDSNICPEIIQPPRIKHR